VKARQSQTASYQPGSPRFFSGSPVSFPPRKGALSRKFRRNLRKISAALAFFALGAGVPSSVVAQGTPDSSHVWERIGPEGGDVISLAACGANTVYLGTADGHIFASEDVGAHWELRGRAGNRFDAVVQALLCDASNSKLLFAGVWFQDPAAGGGVFRSEDAGRTWTPAGLLGEAVRALEQSPSQPDVLVAGTRSGVFHSLDAGHNWERISPVGDSEIHNIDSLALDLHDRNVIYAGTYHLPWKTLDGGKTWMPVAVGMIDDSDIMSMRLDSANPARLFASACSGIYRSDSAGAQWIKLQGIPYAARRTQTIVQDARDAKTLYAGTTTGLWLTHDGGETWARVTPPDWVVNAVVLTAAPPGNHSRLLLGTEDQGVLSSDDGGRTFTPANTGFSHRVIADLVVNPHDSGHLLARLAQQLLESRDAGKTWRPFSGGLPPGGAAKLFSSGDAWWAALDGGGLARYDSPTQKWQRIAFAASNPPQQRHAKAAGKSRGVPKKEQEPKVNSLSFDGTRVYAATSQGVWSGEARSHRLQQFAEKILSGSVRAIFVSSGEQRIAVVTTTEFIFTADTGKYWREINPPADAGELLWLTLAPGEKPMTAPNETLQEWLVGASNGVYLVSGGNQVRWKLLQSGLPRGHSSPPAISAGTMAITMATGGFYLTRDGAKTWERFDSDHETGIFTSLPEDGRDGYFVASRAEGVLHFVASAAKE